MAPPEASDEEEGTPTRPLDQADDDEAVADPDCKRPRKDAGGDWDCAGKTAAAAWDGACKEDWGQHEAPPPALEEAAAPEKACLPEAGAEEVARALEAAAQTLSPGGDLDVHIEGTRMRVHSQLLELASPVFAQRLREAQDSQVFALDLPGKRKKEFELFLSFLRPLSRQRISAASVDAMLPWCDEYQVDPLKEECEDILLRMPVSGARLVQARLFGLQKQYRRCLQELTAAQFQSDFEELVSLPGVVQELLPILQSKSKEWDTVFELIQKLLDANVDLKNVMPIIQVCFGNASTLQHGMLPDLPQLLAGSPDFKALSTALLRRLLECEGERCSDRQRAKAEVHALADLATGRNNQFLRDRILDVADKL